MAEPSKKYFDVLFEGRLVPGQNVDAVARALLSGRLLGAEALAKSLKGHSVVVASGVPLEEAERIRDLFRTAGASCKVVPADPRRKLQRGIRLRAQVKEGSVSERRRTISPIFVAAIGFASLLAGLVYFGRSRPDKPVPAPLAPAPATAGPDLLVMVEPGDRKELVLEAELPVIVEESASLSLRPVFEVRDNDWSAQGVTVDVISNSVQGFPVSPWFLRDATGRTWSPAISSVSLPSNPSKLLDMASVRKLGITQDLRALVAEGALEEPEFRSRMQKAGIVFTGVERKSYRAHRARLTIAIYVPMSRSFEGTESGSGGFSVGSQKVLVDTGSAGASIPFDWWMRLPLTKASGKRGLSLSSPAGAAWKIAPR